jgi:hypothetical protein
MSSLMRAFVARKQRRKRSRFLTRPSLIRRRRRLFVLVPVIFLVDIVRVLFIDLLLILTNNSPTTAQQQPNNSPTTAQQDSTISTDRPWLARQTQPRQLLRLRLLSRGGVRGSKRYVSDMSFLCSSLPLFPPLPLPLQPSFIGWLNVSTPSILAFSTK